MGLIETADRGGSGLAAGAMAAGSASSLDGSTSLARTVSKPKARSARNAKRALALARDD
jgi:hypothetical protein